MAETLAIRGWARGQSFVAGGFTVWDSGSTEWDSGSTLFDGLAAPALVMGAETTAGVLAQSSHSAPFVLGHAKTASVAAAASVAVPTMSKELQVAVTVAAGLTVVASTLSRIGRITATVAANSSASATLVLGYTTTASIQALADAWTSEVTTLVASDPGGWAADERPAEWVAPERPVIWIV